MGNLWQWFNGKKTVIATVLFIVSAFFDQVVVAQWGVTADWIPKLTGSLDWFGMILGGFGLTHKGMKIVKGAQSSQP